MANRQKDYDSTVARIAGNLLSGVIAANSSSDAIPPEAIEAAVKAEVVPQGGRTGVFRTGSHAAAHGSALLLEGDARKAAIETIRRCHYTHSVPSGKSHYFRVEDALVVFSIPANQFVGKFMYGRPRTVWELSRLWAPDGHERNLLTRAISRSVTAFRALEPDVWGLVSYADPNVGHIGTIYRAASWIPCGQVEESRYYLDAAGVVVSRRKFHSGGHSMRKAEILALGYREVKRPGRLRFSRPLTRTARREFCRHWSTRRQWRPRPAGATHE